MRIVVDMQGAQNESRYRGIGRYSLSLARAMARQAGPHELWLALNARFPEGVRDIARSFEGLLPPERLQVFEVPARLNQVVPANRWRVRAAELVRERFLARLRPDVVHITSWFEGPLDDTVASIDSLGLGIPQAVTLYDLIPLLRPDSYLPEVRVRNWYFRKTQFLRRADMLLAISESSASEAREGLLVPDENIAVIGTGVDELFSPPSPDPQRDLAIRQRYGLEQPFIMYTGAADPRKNLAGLLRAIALLPPDIGDGHLLACAGKMYHNQQADLLRLIARFGIPESRVRFLGYVPDADLVPLYAMCELFVFPSIHEGFGLPAAEAMACGAPVIGSNTTSVPSVIGRKDALFDPNDPADMARCITAVLRSRELQADLRAHGIRRARMFSWDDVGRRAIEAFELLHGRDTTRVAVNPGPQRRSLAIVSPLPGAWAASRPFMNVVRKLARDFELTWISDTGSLRRHSALDRIPVRSARWFRKNGGRFDQIVYVLCNNASCGFALPLLEMWTGIVLLTEFSLAHALEKSRAGITTGAGTRSYDSHGLSALVSGRVHELACNEAVFRLSQGVLVSSANQLETVRKLYGTHAAARTRAVPLSISMPAEEIAAEWRAAVAELSAGEAGDDRILFEAISAIAFAPQPGDLEQVSAALSANAPRFGLPQLLVDVSTIADTDARTGIQRVVRSVLSELLALAPEGWRVEPVRVEGEGYVYARDFALRAFHLPPESLPPDAPVETRSGDIFLGLDLIAHLLPPKRSWFEAQRMRGVRIAFVIYDLLPLRRPELFPRDVPPMFRKWSAIVAELADSVICISRAVARELSAWTSEQAISRSQPLQVGWFHLGADLEASLPTRGLPPDADSILAALKSRPFFLSVGTLEPRKRHQQALDAFEHLWASAVDAGFAIVGQQGWRTEELAARISNHPELGRRLFWLRGISDEMLTKVYESCACLLTASEGEGFGLPLIEAARHELPILARDLAVFREVAGESATYFAGEDAQALAGAISGWLARYAQASHIRPDGIRCQTWIESAQQLLQALGIPASPSNPDCNGRTRASPDSEASSGLRQLETVS